MPDPTPAPRQSSSARTLQEELYLVADHARANGYDRAAEWIERAMRPKVRRAKRIAPPPKQPNLERPPRPGDYFRNLRTGWGCAVLDEPQDGYVYVLNGQRRSHVQVNRLLDSKLYAYDGSDGG